VQRDAVPAGKYLCTLIGKREHEAVIEMLVEVAEGRCRGRRIRFAADGAAKFSRASAMPLGERVGVTLRYRPGAAGGVVPVVTNFYAAGIPHVVTVMGGAPSGDGGEATAWPMNYSGGLRLDREHTQFRLTPPHRPLVPCPVFPEELAQQIRLDLGVAKVAGDESAEPATEVDHRYWSTRALERVASDHPYCLLKFSGRGPAVAPFEAAFARYCRMEVDSAGEQPSLVSSFQYGRDVAAQIDARGGLSRDYACPVWSRWLHAGFSADGDPDAAIGRCRLFVTALRRLGVCRHQVLAFTLGGGDLEVMFPSAAAMCLPRPGFEFVVGYLCETIADWSQLCSPQFQNPKCCLEWTPRETQPIDTRLYRPLASVQMPNTCVRESGFYKVRVGLNELFSHEADAISSLAVSPRPFNPPPWQAVPYATLIDIWRHAVAVAVCRSQSIDQITLANRWVYPGTFEFMSSGAGGEEAGARLYAAAMNLLDFGCPFPLLESLLAPAALMSGMRASKVKATLTNAVHASRCAKPLPIEVLYVPDDDAAGWDPADMESSS
jgi:hypothetical protein